MLASVSLKHYPPPFIINQCLEPLLISILFYFFQSLVSVFPFSLTLPFAQGIGFSKGPLLGSFMKYCIVKIFDHENCPFYTSPISHSFLPDAHYGFDHGLAPAIDNHRLIWGENEEEETDMMDRAWP